MQNHPAVGDLTSFYVLGPDVSARGLGDTPLIDGINVVDYEGFRGFGG